MRIDERRRELRVEQRHADHQDEQRQRALEEQIGERKPIVLIQDREHERQRCVMADELHQPWVLIGEPGVAAQVQRGHRERGERDGDDRSLKARPSPLRDRENAEQRGVRDRKQQEAERRRRLAAHRVRTRASPRPPCSPRTRRRGTSEVRALRAAERRVNDHRRQEAERRVRDGGDPRQRRGQAEIARREDHHRADVPDDAERRRRRADAIVGAPFARRDDIRGRRRVITPSIAYSTMPVVNPTRWTSAVRSRAFMGEERSVLYPVYTMVRACAVNRRVPGRHALLRSRQIHSANHEIDQSFRGL